MSKEPSFQDIKEYYESRYENQKRMGYDYNRTPNMEHQRELLAKIHPELRKVDFGCGSPFPPADLNGYTVLDLGSGSGRDCFVMSSLVGDTGKVIGVDFSQKVVDLANTYKEYHQNVYGLKNDVVEFKQGNIEDLKSIGIEDNSVDLVISNCVVNLARSKENVFKEINRVLKPGGELFFSDLYSSCRLTPEIRESKDLWSSCYGGTLYVRDFDSMIRRNGFSNFYIVDSRVVRKMAYSDREEDKNREIMWYSITLRTFKTETELGEEDFGDMVTFKGDQYGDVFLFGQKTQNFQKGVPQRVSSNVFTVLEKSKYNRFFEFLRKEKKVHYGRFREMPTYWDMLNEAEYKAKDVDFSKGGLCYSGTCPTKPKEEEESSGSCCAPPKKKETPTTSSCCSPSGGGCCGN